jgi:hypothetical protein
VTPLQPNNIQQSPRGPRVELDREQEAPVNTKTRNSRSRSTLDNTSVISRCINGFMALRFAKRFNTTVVTAPSFSIATVR